MGSPKMRSKTGLRLMGLSPSRAARATLHAWRTTSIGVALFMLPMGAYLLFSVALGDQLPFIPKSSVSVVINSLRGVAA